MLNPRDAGFVGCRLLALYFLYNVLQWLPHAYSMLSSTLFVVRSHPTPPGGEMLVYTQMLLEAIAKVGLVLFFWFAADWLSKRIFPAEHNAGHPQQWDRQAVISVVPVAIGLVLILRSFVQLADWIYISLSPFDTRALWEAGVGSDLTEIAIRFALGCLFILGGGPMARLITKLKGW